MDEMCHWCQEKRAEQETFVRLPDGKERIRKWCMECLDIAFEKDKHIPGKFVSVICELN